VGEARVLVDGRPAPAGEVPSVPVDDRGLAYGDGVFRTVRIDGGRPWRWADHVAVLRRDCTRLGLPLAAQRLEALGHEAEALVQADDGVLRVTVTRGSGPRGYRPPDAPRPRVILAFHPGPCPPLPAPAVAVRLCRTPVARSPATAGAKTLGRLEQVLARAEWDDARWFEGLMEDGAGALVCGTASNLFLRRGAVLHTPSLEESGVAGVVRERLLGDAALHAALGVEAVAPGRIPAASLRDADEVFLTNAVVGVRAVTRVDGDGTVLFEGSAPGPWASALAERFAAELGSDRFACPEGAASCV
jgi:4-amino-4-deoxychorismate lyase